MRYKAKTLEEAHNELVVYSPDTDPSSSLLHLFHYTSDKSKNLIVNEENHSINFRLTKASDFLDKNEGTYILEPYYNACGYLYDSGQIDFEFYTLLKSINETNILKSDYNVWILCLSIEGYSQFMKERYAPLDGWQIILQARSFMDLSTDYTLDNNHPNSLYLAKVIYSYKKAKQRIQKALLHLYHCYKKDTSYASDEDKNSALFYTIIECLSMYNFCYKSEAYKGEKEIRLICNIKQPFDKWVNPNDSEMSLYFQDEYLYLKFGSYCYFDATQTIDVYNCEELNKAILTGAEISKAIKKRSTKATPNGEGEENERCHLRSLFLR